MDHKTKFTLYDEQGETTEITLDKFVADELPTIAGDVHAWLQHCFDMAASGLLPGSAVRLRGKNTPAARRRAIGDAVRSYALRQITDTIGI